MMILLLFDDVNIVTIRIMILCGLWCLGFYDWNVLRVDQGGCSVEE
jgi:hypothetical protein